MTAFLRQIINDRTPLWEVLACVAVASAGLALICIALKGF